MIINIKDLRKIFQRLMNYLIQLNMQIIVFHSKDDFYLKIWSKDRNNFLEMFNKKKLEEGTYTLGEVSDDIEFLRDILTDKNLVGCGIDMQKMGALLTIVGATLCQAEDKNEGIAASISIDELQQIFCAQMDFLEKCGLHELDFKKDAYYIKIIHSDRYNYLYRESDSTEGLRYEMNLIKNDIKELESLLYGKKREVQLQDFERLGAIITFIGDTL